MKNVGPVNTNISEIMNLDPDMIQRKQYDLLKQHSIHILQTMVQYIHQERWDDADAMLDALSPEQGISDEAGFIDFGVGFGNDSIGDVLNKLRGLYYRLKEDV
jgi:hypothetical protein